MGKIRCFCRARICFLAEDIDCTEGGASGGIGVARPLKTDQLGLMVQAGWQKLTLKSQIEICLLLRSASVLGPGLCSSYEVSSNVQVSRLWA